MEVTKGYSLIELLVVIAIIGIIAAVGYPSYQNYMRDTYRQQAVADLRVCAQALERYYSNGFTYAGGDTGVCEESSPTSGTAKYDVEVTITGGGTGFSVTATPVDETCGSDNCITLTDDGTQTIN